MIHIQGKTAQAFFLFAMLFSSACGVQTSQATPQPLNVYVTSAAYPWLANAYSCAATTQAIVRLSDSASADITIRLGQPLGLRTPAFQIGSEEILVVVNPQTGISSLSSGQVRDVFSGQITSWKDIGG